MLRSSSSKYKNQSNAKGIIDIIFISSIQWAGVVENYIFGCDFNLYNNNSKTRTSCSYLGVTSTEVHLLYAYTEFLPFFSRTNITQTSNCEPFINITSYIYNYNQNPYNYYNDAINLITIENTYNFMFKYCDRLNENCNLSSLYQSTVSHWKKWFRYILILI